MISIIFYSTTTNWLRVNMKGCKQYTSEFYSYLKTDTAFKARKVPSIFTKVQHRVLLRFISKNHTAWGLSIYASGVSVK